MKTIKQDIKAGTYKRVYLLYGTENYLKKLYRDKLKQGVLAGGDIMNFSRFEGKGIDEREVVHIAQTLPFFADYRLVLIENSGWFKNANTFSDLIQDFPDSTVVVFCEDEADERNRLYKAVKKYGHICEFTAMNTGDLKIFAASLLKAEGKKITDATMDYFLEKVGTDMANIRTEIEKLSGYTGDRDVVTGEDVDAICTQQLTGQIFKLMDQIALQNPKNAIALYYDLLLLREKPLSILFLMLRQFNFLLLVKQLSGEGKTNKEIAKTAGIMPFLVGKYLTQAKAFSVEKLKEAVQFGVNTETQIKSGQLNEQIGVELMLIQLSQLCGYKKS